MNEGHAGGGRAGTVLRNPVLHVLLLGIIALAAYWLAFSGGEQADNVIVITRGDVEEMLAKHELTFGKPPSEMEITSMVQSLVREEVLYREAKRLGLDKDDIIIRRRLAQKMDFLSQDIASLAEPTDTAVAAYFEENIENYRIPPQVTFCHLFFNTDARGYLEAREAAAVMRENLNSSQTLPGGARDRGDRVMLPFDFRAATPQDVVSRFGASELADSVFAQPPAAWRGPYASGYGLHLVYVEQLVDADYPEFEDVRDTVREDLADQLRRQANNAFYLALRESYDVVIDDDLRSELGLDSQ